MHKKLTLSLLDIIIIHNYKKKQNKHEKFTPEKMDLIQTLGKNTSNTY